MEVRIATHPEPIRVSYARVRELVPTLWDDGAAPDVVLHIGMAGPRPFYQVERRAHRTGYRSKDVDGCLPDGEPTARSGPRRAEEESGLVWYGGAERTEQLRDGEDDTATEGKKEWLWHGCPEELESDLDIADVLGRWRRLSDDVDSGRADLRLSDDPGRYLCDFIYYSSLAHLWKTGRRRAVTFLHVPADAGEANVERGTKLAVRLIRAIAESEGGQASE